MTPAAPYAIEIDGLWTRYGTTSALEDVTLVVRHHETLGLIGRQGAGKTSLLKSVLMLVTPHAGAIRVLGEPHHTPRSRSMFAYLPQRFRPPGHLSGYDFVRLTLALHGRQAKRSRTALLAEQMELHPAALNRPIQDYSKGMAQKLGILATLMTDLPLLILDEPLSGLDPNARRIVKQQLAAYRARRRTVVLSSPIPSDHEDLCDRVAVLHERRLRYVGTLGELKSRHGAPTLASAFLAEIEEQEPGHAAAP